MFAPFLALDAFLAPRLVRPFYLIGVALALLWGLGGLLLGLVLAVQMFWLGLLTMVFAVASALFVLLAVRLMAETTLASLRLHARFVGGGPNDPLAA